MKLSDIKDPNLRQRIENAAASQNGAFLVKQVPCFPTTKPAKRLRQSTKPLMNVLETEFLARLKAVDANKVVRIQALRYRLGNGIWYKPDFTCGNWRIGDGECGPVAWEVKGPRAFRGGFENLKVAAAMYPEIRWLLVWKDKETGEWKEQEVLP